MMGKMLGWLGLTMGKPPWAKPVRLGRRPPPSSSASRARSVLRDRQDYQLADQSRIEPVLAVLFAEQRQFAAGPRHRDELGMVNAEPPPVLQHDLKPPYGARRIASRKPIGVCYQPPGLERLHGLYKSLGSSGCLGPLRPGNGLSFEVSNWIRNAARLRGTAFEPRVFRPFPFGREFAARFPFSFARDGVSFQDDGVSFQDDGVSFQGDGVSFQGDGVSFQGEFSIGEESLSCRVDENELPLQAIESHSETGTDPPVHLEDLLEFFSPECFHPSSSKDSGS